MHFLRFIFIFVVLHDGLINEALCMSPFIPGSLIPSKKNCSRLVSFLETMHVPYLETYREKTWGIFYKTRARWNYRIETRRSWRAENICCDGYKLETKFVHESLSLGPLFSEVQKTCEPICEPDCGNGTCVLPNVCSCYAGYAEHQDKIYFDKADFHQKNFGCVPVCLRSCVNGRCVAPEICGCNNGYQLSDDDHYTCKPICSSKCGKTATSYCLEPDHCVCLKGWRMSQSTDECEPICSRDCVNGICVSPDICYCKEGYELDPHDQFTCKPVCEDKCVYGKCTAPNVCTCDDGYSLATPSICEPICSEGCVNGVCIAPESCFCYPGYGFLENKYFCEPVCEKACLNGQCTKPDVCMCNNGFQLSGDETEQHICKPRCDMPCEPFGKCTAPNVCTCEEGYRLIDKTLNRTGSNESFTESSVCEPICEFECHNGFCAAPNSCICNPGYHSSNLTGSCEPVCDAKCINGFCAAPNSCVCHSGYQSFNLTNICKPICDPNCENGVCEQPNVCSCNPGYRASTKFGPNVCEPICHPTCETIGICEAPNICICKPGYLTVPDNGGDIPFKCEPICNDDCNAGNCVVPGICACSVGYRRIKTGECEPICDIKCGNGTCVAPETCKCDNGFVLSLELSATKNTTESRCLPSCEGCENGECEAPGECRCHVGFAKIEGTCVQFCQGGCGAHGACIEERRTCKCEYGWTGPHCDQPTLCVLILNGNYTKELTIIEEQNTTIKHVFTNNPACSECVSKVTNETLCFKMTVNDSKNVTQIGCLMNKECLALSSQYKDQGEIMKVTGGIVAGVLLLMAIVYLIFLILRQRRSRQADLDVVQTICRHSTSMQGLIGSNTNNS
ncbi:tenascin-like isoform X1 [Cardiocondyla obscurior]